MSLSKNKISYIQSLKHKKYRSEHNTFVAEGSKLVFDLLPHMKCQLLVIVEDMSDNLSSFEAEETVIANNNEIKKASHLTTPCCVLSIRTRLF